MQIPQALRNLWLTLSHHIDLCTTLPSCPWRVGHGSGERKHGWDIFLYDPWLLKQPLGGCGWSEDKQPQAALIAASPASGISAQLRVGWAQRWVNTTSFSFFPLHSAPRATESGLLSTLASCFLAADALCECVQIFCRLL